MEKTDIQKLRDLPIEGVAKRLGLTVSRHKSLCPFHPDQHPSLSYHISTNTYRCFVCGAHGGTIDLAMKLLPFKGRSGGVSFPETCQWLANEHNVILTEWQPAHKPSNTKHKPDVQYLSSLVARPFLNAEARTFLFDVRHYNPKVVEWLGISSISRPTPCWRYGKPFYDAPSLLFPYKDINGNVLNIQSRYLGPPQMRGEEEIPRFRFPSNSSIHIFNLPILRYLKPNEPLFISEGITDCIAHLSAGHKALAIPSATLLKPEDLKPISGRQLHIFPDNDSAGERMYRQLLTVATQIGSSLIRHPLPEGCKDFSDYWISITPHP